MKLSLQKKFLLTSMLLLVVLTGTAALIISIELQRLYRTRLSEQLSTQLDEIEYLLAFLPWREDSLAHDYATLAGYAHASSARLTLIDVAGEVLFDSRVPLDSLWRVENHLNRPEVRIAFERGIGHDQRLSATVGSRMYYAAKLVTEHHRLPPGLQRLHVVRLAIPLEQVERTMTELRWKIFAGSGAALLLIAVLGYLISNKLTKPIQHLAQVADSVKKGDLDAHFERTTDDEIGELAGLLNEMVGKLRTDLVQMRKLETVRRQFLGNVSHELRTPIFAVQGYLETLLEADGMAPDVRKSFVEKAYKQAGRLNNLLADLIDISRIESGEMKMSFRYFDVREWLEKQAAEMATAAQEHFVALALNLPVSNLPVHVFGDRERLTQVLYNLVSNAIKYNLPGGKVEIGFENTMHEAVIHVADTGRGIPEEHLPRIFERFYRVDKERSRAVGGTGLGLAIVKHIIEAHGSQVSVHSEVGKGSRFSFALSRGLHHSSTKATSSQAHLEVIR